MQVFLVFFLVLWEGIFCYWWYLTAFPVIPQSHYLSAGQRSWMSLVIVYTSLTVFEFLIFQFVLCVYVFNICSFYWNTYSHVTRHTIKSCYFIMTVLFLNHEVILVFSNTSHGFSRPVLFAYTLFSLSNFQACAPPFFFPFHLFVLQHHLRWMISVSQIRPWWTF